MRRKLRSRAAPVEGLWQVHALHMQHSKIVACFGAAYMVVLSLFMFTCSLSQNGIGLVHGLTHGEFPAMLISVLCACREGCCAL